AHGVPWADIVLSAVASGPGSVPALRIGIATIPGLAFVNRRRVVAVAALDALAQVASADRAAGTIVAAWMDAHRHDVFTALYRVTDAPLFTPERLAAVEAPSVGDPLETLTRWSAYFDRGSVFIGDGAVKYRGEIDRGAAGAASGSVLSGESSTSCTSTTSRCSLTSGAAAPRRRCWRTSSRRGRGSAPAAQRSRSGDRTRLRGPSTNGSGSSWPACGVATT